MESITIFNWTTLAMMISILGFMTKIYNDFRKAEKAIRNEVHESEKRTRGEIHESERRTSNEIRELSNQLAELRGVLKGSGALAM